MNYQTELAKALGAEPLQAARDHARQEFPKESCGFIAGNTYYACENKHANPLDFFMIDDERYDRAMATGAVRAIVHSHPNGRRFPTASDMASQITTDVPWVIVPLNETEVVDLSAWGDGLDMAPIIGRPFVHGIFDCYSTIRDVFRLGKDGLLAQGIGWPHPPIELPQVARDDDWWKSEQDLYVDHLKPFGFRPITRPEILPGDIFLMKLGDARGNPHERINHGGVLIDSGLLIQHLPRRLSRREPSAVWARAADMWVRYEGAPL